MGLEYAVARSMKVFLTLALLLAFACAIQSHAQPFGLSMVLNPEGTRLFPQSILFPRHPGKPDPRWKSFEWNFIEEKSDHTHYRLYLYESEDWSARFAIPRINAEIKKLSQIFSYTPSKKFSYLLFTSRREFRQANIFDISEGVQGITSTQESTMAIPYWGEAQSFDHVSTHELVHQFQVQKINDLSEFPGSTQTSLFPLWFIEGMAEYYSLNGIDLESKTYLRDVVLNAKNNQNESLPKFFEEGAYNFVSAYKIGQAKIDFLETRFSEGCSQKILEQLAKSASTKAIDFKDEVSNLLQTHAEQIEKDWDLYLKKYLIDTESFPQPLSEGKTVWGTSESSDELIDSFDISPNGEFVVFRKMDKISGISSIQLVDLKNKKSYELIEDNQPDALSLLFMQSQTLAIQDNRVSYVVETTSGPELEVRSLLRNSKGELSISHPLRIRLHQLNVLEVSSVTLSPEGESIALVELGPDGSQNILLIEDFLNPKKRKIRKLTHDHYSWKTLSWDANGILASGDRTKNGFYGIFRIDPDIGTLLQLTSPELNEQSPSLNPEGILIQSWRSGSSQAHLLYPDKEEQITDIPTGIFSPRLRNKIIYGLILEKGRYRLAYFDLKHWQSWKRSELESSDFNFERPWTPQTIDLPPHSIHPYQPFFSQGGHRLDNAGAFLASGGFIGISAVMSDLMRDYIISGNLLMLGNLDRTSASGFLTGRKGRSKWTIGIYREMFPMLDTIFPQTRPVKTYLHREWGILGAIKYPFNPFTFTDFELRVAGVNRTGFSDPSLKDSWQSLNPGSELLLAPTLRLGYDRLIYETYTGPLKGFGALLEVESNIHPMRRAFSHRIRADLSNYWNFPGRTVLQIQGVAATTWGDRYRNSFLVSSDDILRAYPYSDDRLYGDSLIAWKTEFRFPIGSLLGLPFLRGLLAYDLGSVFSDQKDIGYHIASSTTAGLTLNIAPLSINLMVSHPIREANGPSQSQVWHFTLRYLYL